MGVGRYQWILYLTLSVFWVADGGEAMILSFTNPIIKNVWNLGDEINYVYSFVFAGYMIGAICSGKISKKFSGNFGNKIYADWDFITACFHIGQFYWNIM